MTKRFNSPVYFKFSVDHDGDDPTLAEIVREFTSRVGLSALSNSRCEELAADDFDIGEDRIDA